MAWLKPMSRAPALLKIVGTLVFLSTLAVEGVAADPGPQGSMRIYLDPNVQMPEEPLYMGGMDMGAVMLGGAIGGAIAGEDTTKEELVAAGLEESSIAIDEIVYDKFFEVISRDLGGLITGGDGADARLELKVKAYGFMAPQAFMSKVHPFVSVKMRLTDSNGDSLWGSSANARKSSKDKKPDKIEDWLSDSSRLRTAFELRAELVAEKLVSRLKKNLGDISDQLAKANGQQSG